MTLTTTNKKTGRSEQKNVKSIVLDKGEMIVTLGDGSKFQIGAETVFTSSDIRYVFT